MLSRNCLRIQVIFAGRWLLSCLALCLLAGPESIAAEPPAIISEFMAANSSTHADEDGHFSDWIEIFNPGSASLNLNGWFLTDDSDLPNEISHTLLPASWSLLTNLAPASHQPNVLSQHRRNQSRNLLPNRDSLIFTGHR